MKRMTIAVDVHKSVFEIAVSQTAGKVSERVRLSRGKVTEFFAQRQPATVVLEACGSSHFWGRTLRELGHAPLLLPPGEVRAYVRRQKNDQRDAKGLLEAVRNDEIRPVPIKTIDQQALASLHRVRSAWIQDRTARLNLVRGLLREFGIVIPLGATRVVPRVEEMLSDPESHIPTILRSALRELCDEIRALEARVTALRRQLEALAAQSEEVQRLCTVPGIGVLTATAMVALVGDMRRFPSGRHLASYLGLTPRQRQSGGRQHLGRISKQGDAYLRTLLMHGARSLLWAARRRPEQDRLRLWALQVQERRGHNKAAAAVANKLARIAWAISVQQRPFRVISSDPN